MFRDLFKGSLVYGLAPFVPRILTILLLPILTKYLTSLDYGIIGTITAITFAVESLRDLGLRVLLPNYFYKSPGQYKVAWREIYGFLSLWMMVFALIQSVALYYFIPDEAEDNKWYIIIFSNFSTVLFGPTSIIGSTYYQLNLKPMPVAVRSVISAMVTILVNFICVVIYKWGYMGAYVGSFAGTFIVNLSYWPFVNRKLGLSPIYMFKWHTIYRMLKISVPTIPHAYSGYLLNSSSVVAMNMYKMPQTDIGNFTMARNMSSIFDSVLYAINQVFNPMCYKFIREKNPTEIKRMSYTFIIMAYAMTFIFSLWSREFYDILVSNEEIAATYKYSIGFVMAYNYIPVYVYCSTYFFFHEHTVKLLLITFVSGVVGCTFYFVTLPWLGVNGAIIGFYLGCLYQGYSGYLFSFYKEKSIFKMKWQILLMIQLFLTAIAYCCVDMTILVKFLITLLFVSVFGLFFIKRVMESDLNFLKKVLMSKRSK